MIPASTPPPTSGAMYNTNNQSLNVTSGSLWSALLLGLMMLLAPAIGVPSEEMLQDTLKSAVISCMAICAAMTTICLRPVPVTLRWHHILWLPLGLMLHALGSMVWSHSYLAGAEGIRWFIFSLILYAGINTSTVLLQSRIAWGIHLGVTIASLWTALQFWTNFNLFPQGPNPASTFVNRNFFAEYAVCALPYSAFLLLKSGRSPWSYLLAATLGFNFVALLMTGTRSALVALIVLALLLPLLLLRFRQSLASAGWTIAHGVAISTAFWGTVLVLGTLPNHNPKIFAEFGPQTAIDRAAGRTASVTHSSEYQVGSFSIRSSMWKATGRMIADNPLTGVGAGAWEVQVPRYQDAGTQLETDFYAHNEILQLLAEYGVVGWAFLLLLLSYLARAAWTTAFDLTEFGKKIAPLRATALTSIFLLLIVCNAGFPWRLASTGAIFALSLAILAACDFHNRSDERSLFTYFRGGLMCRRVLAIAGTACIALSLYITQRAAYAESNLVRGIRMGLIIARSGNHSHEYWNGPKSEMLEFIRRGIHANPHYRKLTAIAADELASIGDWRDARWIWESVLISRPYVSAIIVNIARAHMEEGHYTQAQQYLHRAEQLQPTAIATRSLRVVLLSRMGQDEQALPLVEELISIRNVDYELVRAAHSIGERTRNWPLAIQALELRLKRWPSDATETWLELGEIYDQKIQPRNEGKALSAYRNAIKATTEQQRDATLAKIPHGYRAQL